MEDYNFGDILREARQRSGEDLVSVARKLRIRPDILERIEESDLDGMPPRGYSRNMINAYARYLGLNPTDVVKSYLDSQYRAQVENARKNIRPSGFDMTPARRHHGLREEVHVDERSRARSEAAQRSSMAGSGGTQRSGASARSANAQSPSSTSRGLRRSDSSSYGSARPSQSRSYGGSSFDEGLFDDIDSGAAPRELSSAERAIASRPPDAARTRRVGAVHVGSYNGYGQGLYRYSRQQRAAEDPDRTRRLDDDGERPSSRRSTSASPSSTRRLRREQDEQGDVYMRHQSRRSAQPERHSISVYAAPSNLGGNPGGLREKLPFLIAGVIILLLVVLIGFLVNGIGSQATSNAQQSTPMNVTGLPEATSSSSSSSSSSGSTTTSTSADSSSQKASSETEKKAEAAPTKTVIEYSIASGKTPYIEVYDGDSCLLANSVSGPSTESYDVTSTFTIVASPYDGLSITQDGVAVDLDDYVNNGVVRFEVNFSDVLAAWKEAHPDSSAA